jgi:hypothetical protein
VKVNLWTRCRRLWNAAHKPSTLRKSPPRASLRIEELEARWLPSGNPPVAMPDQYTVQHDQTFFAAYNPIDPPSVLMNDWSPDGNTITAVLGQPPAHGQLQLNDDGSFMYTPDVHFLGTDSFTYQASDGTLLSPPVPVTLQVVNQAPVAAPDNFTVPRGQSLLNAPLLANDSDDAEEVPQPVIVTAPRHGTVTVNADGTINFTPDSQYAGPDSFTYVANDGIANSNVATVSLNVTDPPAPVANDDLFTVGHGQAQIGANVRANDNIPPGTPPLLTILVSAPAHGTAFVQDDGTITYQPAGGFAGTDSFTYKLTNVALTNAGAESNVATVTVSVTNQAPSARNANLNALQNGSLSLSVLTDTNVDPEGDPLTLGVVQGPTHGQVTLTGDGDYVYTPNAGFVGADSFTYKVNDGAADSSVATATVNVIAGDLVANDQLFSGVANDLTFAISQADLLANVTTASPDATPQISSVSAPQYGTLAQDTDGNWIYTPPPGFTGMDQFTYTAQLGASVATALVMLQVGPGMGAPATHLDDVLVQRFNFWAQGGNAFSLDNVNLLIQARNTTAQDAAALVILKLYVLQYGANDTQFGPYGSGTTSVFGTVGRAVGGAPQLTRANIDRYRALRDGTAVPPEPALTQLARLLDTRFARLARSAASLRTDLFANVFPDRATSEQLARSIQQGIVGDCSFLSALINFTRQTPVNDLQRRIRPAAGGGYEVQLYNLARGEWQWIAVDPLTVGQRLLYARANDGTLWVSLFEAAYLRLVARERARPNSPSESCTTAATTKGSWTARRWSRAFAGCAGPMPLTPAPG